ncbi:hypothetical protein E2C01_069432 [Portunus trituberculatus]|uniref:Reverse transcriptase zinc-binding domain-containing protein n=1 Tax=Portunus trituberculatus TaxID=210409 RepID=A0A5B7I265_PORTR|nr:hypothetical protein [Portunus trituberculatus]
MSAVIRFKQSVTGEGTQATPVIARLPLGHTTLGAHLHRLRLSSDHFCPWCRTTLEAMEHFLAASCVYTSRQSAVLRLTCAFLRKTGRGLNC